MGREAEGEEGGKETPTIVQIIYVLKTANSRGKKFKPLVQVSLCQAIRKQHGRVVKSSLQPRSTVVRADLEHLTAQAEPLHG